MPVNALFHGPKPGAEYQAKASSAWMLSISNGPAVFRGAVAKTSSSLPVMTFQCASKHGRGKGRTDFDKHPTFPGGKDLKKSRGLSARPGAGSGSLTVN